jgi:hypothetical protein
MPSVGPAKIGAKVATANAAAKGPAIITIVPMIAARYALIVSIVISLLTVKD